MAHLVSGIAAGRWATRARLVDRLGSFQRVGHWDAVEDGLDSAVPTRYRPPPARRPGSACLSAQRRHWIDSAKTRLL